MFRIYYKEPAQICLIEREKKNILYNYFKFIYIYNFENLYI